MTVNMECNGEATSGQCSLLVPVTIPDIQDRVNRRVKTMT